MNTTTTTEVLIVGAGPTGLTMALMLTHSGIPFRIIDKKKGIVEESRALVMHAKTLELFDKLNLAEQAVAEGEKVGAVQMFREGKPAGKLTFMKDNGARTPFPFALIYAQNCSEALLLHRLEALGKTVEWETEVLDLIQIPGGVQTIIRRSDNNAETIDTHWVIGADGAHSPIRHALSLGFSGETYEQPLFIADVEIDWALESQKMYMDLTPVGFFAFFPMPGKHRYRALGIIPPSLAHKDSLTLDEVQAIINSQSGLKLTLTKAYWISIYRTHHRMTERFRVGRVFLIGDAAHIHSPAGGQGMNTGIGDAYNLAWKLALVIKGQAHETLLASYETERVAFARAILRGSDAGFHLQATTNPLLQRLKLRLVPELFHLVSSQSALQKRAFWLLSQLWTTYRKSPSVAKPTRDKQGPQPGDRAPYAFFEAGSDTGTSIFDKLKDLDHHLVLFSGQNHKQAITQLDEVERQLSTLLADYEIPIQLHAVPTGNPTLHKHYGATTPTIFLIRPDGHIAYRGPAEDLNALKAYLDSVFTHTPQLV